MNSIFRSMLFLVLCVTLSSGCNETVQSTDSKVAEQFEEFEVNQTEQATPQTPVGEALSPRTVLQKSPYPTRRLAPSLLGGKAWLNTEKPLAVKELKGKFVLLDFWTYCCINCMHVLPELEKLENAFPNELVVVGVHSAKFEAEKDTANIRSAILRYDIKHPVVNDAEMTIWNRYGIRSWPTMVLIDPEGFIVWRGSGEQSFEKLSRLIKFGLPYYRAKGLIDVKRRRFRLERDAEKKRALLFPGKILADEKNNRLFITDSNHHRIVVSSLQGKVELVIGSGKVGVTDGDYESASFNHPQGLALVGNTLYVADTENHLLRKVDLAKKMVTTIAGTGKQAHGPWQKDGKPNITALSSPWTLWPHDGTLYIAMAGRHQIWAMPLDESSIGPFAGSGAEDIIDGKLLPAAPYQRGHAAFAQPSGLTSDGKQLFIADSEGSSIRAIPLQKNNEQRVSTLVGTSHLLTSRLFIFGDRDGKGLLQRKQPITSLYINASDTEGPLLQHALGVAWANDKLYIADTYNNKIKVYDFKTEACTTLAGTGEPGNADGIATQATFDEPAGLAVANGVLYIADTNNHTIRMIDLKTNVVSTLALDGLLSE